MEKRITWRLSLQMMALALGFCTAGPIWAPEGSPRRHSELYDPSLSDSGSDEEVAGLTAGLDELDSPSNIFTFSPLPPLPPESDSSPGPAIAPSVASSASPPPVASSSPEPGSFEGSVEDSRQPSGLD